VLRTFSKIYGLAGLRVGYGIGPEDVITAIGKVRRAFDVTSAGQEAALASLGEEAEVERRRLVNLETMELLRRALGESGLPFAEPAVANFLFVRVGDAEAASAALLRRGVIVRPMAPFGSPDALRITAGTPDEIAFLADALGELAPTLRAS
jgi:histidinol-phosphate aminotransferase